MTSWEATSDEYPGISVKRESPERAIEEFSDIISGIEEEVQDRYMENVEDNIDGFIHMIDALHAGLVSINIPPTVVEHILIKWVDATYNLPIKDK